ncbi:aminotransferase [Marinicella pacifica]|uniref:Aminotransferase n=1 Tax=Marinicella pacifica TaxID=1171543 RepID=A0A917FPQ3_9GAMM|nr:methionine aminotransferase [Marinicella pacifica]GGF96308.1 aminotransferase [Marinicella pacifica]
MTEPSFQSKLPHLGTSIFTEMSILAHEYKAINLSQGFPEFDTPDFLKEGIQQAISEGKNQYAPSPGIPDLLTQIGELVQRCYIRDEARRLDPMKNIAVTTGATEALWVAFQTLIRPGDEVIVFDPAYDAYEPDIQLSGGVCRHVAMTAADYAIDWQQVRAAVNDKTRAIVINSPHNPTGTLLSQEDMEALQDIVLEHGLYVISDEVYEHMTFDGRRHESVLRYPDLFERSFVISSFGKSFHCTGWKLGYCVAPEYLMTEFKKIHQYVTFSSFTPAQYAIAKMLESHPQHIDALSDFYQQKRDVLVNALKGSRFKILPSQGTYFLLLDYSAVSDLNDLEFSHWLTKEIGVATIPLSPFYQTDSLEEYHKDNKVVRLCFAKHDETLIKAAEVLSGL